MNHALLRTNTLVLAVALAARSAGAPVPVAATTDWTVGETLAAGPEHGEERQLAPGITVTLTPGTRVVRRSPIRVSGGSSTHAPSLELLEGRLEIEIAPSFPSSRPVVVRAPRKVTAVIREGHSVIAADQGAVAIAALKGQVTAAMANSWRSLPEGSVRAFTADDPQGRVRPVLAAARPALSSQLVLAVPGLRRPPVQATWEPVAGATGYDVVLHRQGPAGARLQRRVQVPKTTATFDALTPGAYTLTVRALDAWNVGGPPSDSVALRVIAVDLPSGAQVDNGVVLLGRHQRVSFSHAEGLELSYDDAADFVPVPNTVGLRRGHSVRVRLRQPGHPEEATLSMVAWTLEAEVELWPRLARWPRDQVTTRVRLRGHHAAVRDERAAKPEITINGKAVAARWSRRGNVLQATVPNPTTPGPWVVRVHVFDRYGDLIARDFLEVSQ